ncbi:hypothetical protein MUU53_02905 [Rhizobium lemnae]|uniref:Uncharacterized protein n=1 Tax=Rhizobium lemnae TaxID=1214924 RepID=A0ABV8EAF8_9HYPH|nr:hypothetical protein [Rhizobium lemnae]MCJ8506858.1 hypothetical protein [Rhizobium lemnae]
MPQTLIHIVNSSWTAEVANTSIAYRFKGATLLEQRTSVTEFAANTFNSGATGMEDFFDGSDPGNIIAEQLFGSTNELVYQNAVILQAGGGADSFLIEELQEVGDALLQAI